MDAAKLQIRDGVISSTEDPKKKITFAELVKANKGAITHGGQVRSSRAIGRAMNRGVGACFAEVEVDTWTGDWRYVRAAYCHDAGHVMNPLLANADHAWIAGAEHGDDHRRDSVGPGISRHAALQRGLFVLPAADDHGAAGPDQRIHQQPRSRAGFSAPKVSRKRPSARLRARWPTPSTTPAACAFGSIRLPRTRSWPA